MTSRRSAALVNLAGVLGVLGLALGCASTEAKEDRAAETPEGVPVENTIDEPMKWSEDLNRDNRKIGFILAELDRSLRIWNDLVLAGKTTRDAHSVKLIEEAIAHDAAQHFDPIVDQLTGGPPNNRRVAAAALGFARVSRALGPLLAALSDPDAEVVSNALLSIGTLRSPETPLTSIASLMSDHPSPNVRNNAARALRSLLPVVSAAPPRAAESSVAESGVAESSADDPDAEGSSTEAASADVASIEDERAAVRTAARRAVGDPEPAVRTSALLLLAELGDYESFDRIALALADDVALVARAASRAVAHIGANHNQYYGRAARALTAAMLEVEGEAVEQAIRTDLQQFSGRNYGDDTDEWLKWANRLP